MNRSSTAIDAPLQGIAFKKVSSSYCSSVETMALSRIVSEILAVVRELRGDTVLV